VIIEQQLNGSDPFGPWVSTMTKEMTQNRFKVGDWVHTMDGIGTVAGVFPVYYQYWQKLHDDKYREETYGNNEALGISLLGEPREVGEWIKDILYVKRLCDHDAAPKKRFMCFFGLAYANDTITKKEMAEVRRILKNDPKLAARFEKLECTFRQPVRAWSVQLSEAQIVAISKAIQQLENNTEGKLAMTMTQVAGYFEKEFDVDLLELMLRDRRGNATIATRMMPENDANYYNADREEMICEIRIDT